MCSCHALYAQNVLSMFLVPNYFDCGFSFNMKYIENGSPHKINKNEGNRIQGTIYMQHHTQKPPKTKPGSKRRQQIKQAYERTSKTIAHRNMAPTTSSKTEQKVGPVETK